MEWLKTILQSATITDGKLDIESVIKLINTEFPKHAVPKDDYNTKVKELNTANTTLGELKKQNEGNVDLQKKLEEYETTITDLQKENADTKKQFYLVESLKSAGCVDPEYLIFKHGGIDKFAFDKSGNPIGIEDTVKPYKESAAHLFKTEQKPNYNPSGGGGSVGTNPFSKETFNLTEQGKLLRDDPAQAKELAAAAGVHI